MAGWHCKIKQKLIIKDTIEQLLNLYNKLLLSTLALEVWLISPRVTLNAIGGDTVDRTTNQPKMKIFFTSIASTGHINACIGLAQGFAKRGHEIFFLYDQSFRGQYEKYGFKEIFLVSTFSQAASGDENMASRMSKEAHKEGLFSNATPGEKLKALKGSNVMEQHYQMSREANEQIEEAIREEKPDLIVVDNFAVPASILCGQLPWVNLTSCSPVLIYESNQLPPPFFGLPVADQSEWNEARKIYQECFVEESEKFELRLLKAAGCPEIKLNGASHYKSPYLNIYGYPQELDYTDILPMPEKFIRVDAFCRSLQVSECFEFPDGFRNPTDKVIYVSLGTTGSADVSLMKRLVAMLADSPHKYIVSKGPSGDEFRLAENMWGETYLPQTRILPLVDLVITHGGNNTVCEAFVFGKPMIVMPLNVDQFDNGQRIEEKGYGFRFDPYRVEKQQLLNTIDRMLHDRHLQHKYQVAAKRIANANSKELACIAIEEMVARN